MSEHAQVDPNKQVLWILAVVVLLVLASFAFGRYATEVMTPKPPKLAVYGTLQADLQAQERSGQYVNFSDLKGKVVACAYLYTVCPHGCAAVVAQMQKLHHDFGARSDFHQLSVAVVPERDTPVTLASYAEALGVKPGDHWWFVTGPRDPLVGFMTRELRLNPCRFIPPGKRLNPADMFEHDLRIVLIDRAGQVRGYYDVFHPQAELAALMCERLHRDAKALLDDPIL
ncbi:MAG: SCO family protein [Verrucomicrobiaceae bacterium]|nr:SCO family protein [Verrucomicrobiaceae bacterium]